MRSRRFSTNFVLAIAALTLLATTAQADVTISSQPTQNMTCSGGVCAPTAKTAVLNVGDLETLLAAGNVTVTTQGFRNKQANNIVIAAALSWATPSSLKLDAFQSVTIDGSVAVNGLGGLAIVTDEGGTSGTFSVGMNSSVEFQNLSSSLTINGAGYSLVNSVATLERRRHIFFVAHRDGVCWSVRGTGKHHFEPHDQRTVLLHEYWPF